MFLTLGIYQKKNFEGRVGGNVENVRVYNLLSAKKDISSVLPRQQIHVVRAIQKLPCTDKKKIIYILQLVLTERKFPMAGGLVLHKFLAQMGFDKICTVPGEDK